MLDHPRLRHLTPHERGVLSEFLSRLRERCSDHITHVWIFGSKVRGDFDEESDVDLLIVVRDGNDVLGGVIGEIAYDLSLEHGVLLCDHVISAWRFAQMRARQEPLYESIMREEVGLWALEIVPTRVAEEQASYNLGTPEDYLRHRLEQSERIVARLERFSHERGLLTNREPDDG
ncbi:MAG: nucleotidyltransferase domain-containing protein [Chloroflexota bacterium]|nr:nucleotidyltransferase domain-containing protein [Chloroflexota bacterium]